MPTREKIIRDATLVARNAWFDYTVEQEKKIFKLFDDAANRLIIQINAAAVAGEIPPARLVGLLQNVTEEMKRIRPKLAATLEQGMRRSVDFGISGGIYGADVAKGARHIKVGVGTSFIGKDGVIRRYDPRVELYKDSVWARINGEAMDSLLRFDPGGLMFSERVFDITWQSQKAIRSAINTAVLLGHSPQELSRAIRGFLAEPEKLFRRVRDKKTGKLVLSKPTKKLVLSRPAKAFTPGAGVYRSSYKNALRVARTEMARAYHEGTLRYGREKSWIKGNISHTTSGNPAPYDDSVDGQFFAKDDPPDIPYHPNCVCFAEIVMDDTPDSQLIKAPSKAEWERANK